MPKISAKFDRGHHLQGHQVQVGWVKIGDFRQITPGLSLVMSECSLSGHGQGHVSNFYIMDLESFATASRRYAGDIHNSVYSRFVYDTNRTVEATQSRHGWVHMFITHRPTVTLQRHNFDLFRSCCTSSFCTAARQLARFQLTRCIAWSLSDSWAPCLLYCNAWFLSRCGRYLNHVLVGMTRFLHIFLYMSNCIYCPVIVYLVPLFCNFWLTDDTLSSLLSFAYKLLSLKTGVSQKVCCHTLIDNFANFRVVAVPIFE